MAGCKQPRQQQVHVVQARNPLPACVVIVQCGNCDEIIWRGGMNTKQLAAVLAQVRREHAVLQHGWMPLGPQREVEADASG